MATSVSQRLNVQDYSVGYNNAVFSIICESWYFTYEKYLHGRIKSLSQESERSCIVFQVSIFPFSSILISYLELFRQRGIFCFSCYRTNFGRVKLLWNITRNFLKLLTSITLNILKWSVILKEIRMCQKDKEKMTFLAKNKNGLKTFN